MAWEITVEQISEVIRLAEDANHPDVVEKYDAKTFAELDTIPPNPHQEKLKAYLSELSHRALSELTAIWWIGSRTEPFSKWEKVLAHAQKVTCVGYVASNFLLAKHVRRGWDMLPEWLESSARE